MAFEPLLDWDQTFRFLELLGRTPDSTEALLFPPKEGPGSDKGAKTLKLDEAGRQSAERTLAMPLYRHHSLGVKPNPGGAKASDITEGVALFFECDGGLPLKAQAALPELLGLPEPTMTVWTGGRSLHQYWCAEEGGSLSPQAWRKAQERLIAAVDEIAPKFGVDHAIKDPGRVMRAAGGIHPATGERCHIYSESGARYDLATLAEMLPLPVVPLGPSPSQKRWEGLTEEVESVANHCKATDALAYLPPEHFTGYMEWLGVGMALHSVTPDLLNAWICWSRGMGDVFDEEECHAKWETFTVERADGLGLGSLIRLAQRYGYQPPGGGADTPSRSTAAPPPSGKLSPVLLTTRGLKEMTIAALQRGCQS